LALEFISRIGVRVSKLHRWVHHPTFYDSHAQMTFNRATKTAPAVVHMTRNERLAPPPLAHIIFSSTRPPRPRRSVFAELSSPARLLAKDALLELSEDSYPEKSFSCNVRQETPETVKQKPRPLSAGGRPQSADGSRRGCPGPRPESPLNDLGMQRPQSAQSSCPSQRQRSQSVSALYHSQHPISKNRALEKDSCHKDGVDDADDNEIAIQLQGRASDGCQGLNRSHSCNSLQRHCQANSNSAHTRHVLPSAPGVWQFALRTPSSMTSEAFSLSCKMQARAAEDFHASRALSRLLRDHSQSGCLHLV